MIEIINRISRYKYNNFYWFTIPIVLFSTLLLVIFWCNRMGSGDDLWFYIDVQERGVFGALYEFEYNARYVSFFVFNMVFYWIHDFPELPLLIFTYHFIFFLLLVVSIFYFLKVAFKELRLLDYSRPIVLIYSFMILMVIFFGSPNLIDDWIWIVSSTVYTFPLIFLFFGMALFIKKNLTYWQKGLMYVSFFLVGGCLETLAVCVIFIFGLIFLLGFKYAALKKFRLKLIISSFFTSIFLILNFVIGAFTVRKNFEHSYESKYISFNDFMDTFFDDKNFFVLCGFAFFFLAGLFFKSSRELAKKINLKSFVLINLFLLIGIWTITMVPLFIVFRDWGPARAWFPFHFFLSLSCSFWFWYLGSMSNFKVNWKIVTPIFSVLLSILFLNLLIKKSPLMLNYARTYDDQITELVETKEEEVDSVYYWKKIPTSPYSVGFAIFSNPKKGQNKKLKKVLKLNFPIVGKK